MELMKRQRSTNLPKTDSEVSIEENAEIYPALSGSGCFGIERKSQGRWQSYTGCIL